MNIINHLLLHCVIGSLTLLSVICAPDLTPLPTEVRMLTRDSRQVFQSNDQGDIKMFLNSLRRAKEVGNVTVNDTSSDILILSYSHPKAPSHWRLNLDTGYFTNADQNPKKLIYRLTPSDRKALQKLIKPG